MNACYIHINWDSMKHVSVERNLGLKRDVVAICDMGNGIEICMTAEMARDLAQQMTDLADEIERESEEKYPFELACERFVADAREEDA